MRATCYLESCSHAFEQFWTSLVWRGLAGLVTELHHNLELRWNLGGTGRRRRQARSQVALPDFTTTLHRLQTKSPVYWARCLAASTVALKTALRWTRLTYRNQPFNHVGQFCSWQNQRINCILTPVLFSHFRFIFPLLAPPSTPEQNQTAMLAPLSLLALLAIPRAISALPYTSGPSAFESNQAYRSPSLTVQALEVDTAQIFMGFDEFGLAKRWKDTYSGNLTFPYGVASGDPYFDSVILWTMPRKLDLEGLYGGNAWPPICLAWIVSASPTDFSETSMVQNGFVQTSEDIRFSVKVEAINLQPYTKYYYRFESCEGADLGVSPVGIFKTLPADDVVVPELRVAFYSCSNLPFGFFNAYGAAANHSDTLDWVQHIGDYIYEYKNGDYGDGTAIGRVPQPDRELASLQDYRDRYAQYRTDPDLQELHRVLAWQTVWDDHEVADTWKAGSADSNNTLQGQVGDFQFSERKANAVRAYYEWMPIRQVATDDKLRIWRNFKLGKLADMIMLDTRQYDRDETDLYYNTAKIEAESGDPERSMTGTAQQKWFFDQMDESSDRGATWRLVMQQVVFSRVNYSLATHGAVDFNVDAWEGYRVQRDNILKHIEDNKINNTVILSGDSHATWISDLKRENSTTYNPVTGEGALGVEFAGSAVSSPSSYGHGPGFTDQIYVGLATELTANSPSLQFAEGQLRGYIELTITPKDVTADVFGFYDQLTRNTNVTHIASFGTKKDSNKLTRPLNNGTVPAFGSLGAGATK